MRPFAWKMGWQSSLSTVLVAISCLVSIAHSLQFPLPSLRISINCAPSKDVWKLKFAKGKSARPSYAHHVRKAKSSKEDEFSGNHHSMYCRFHTHIFLISPLKTGMKIPISDFPDSVLREVMELDTNHDGFLDISEISKALLSKSKNVSNQSNRHHL